LPNTGNLEGYNSPEKIRNDNNNYENYIYNTPIQNTKHITISSPVKYNKPIYQYKRTEETVPITYSPTKILPPTITYDSNIQQTKSIIDSPNFNVQSNINTPSYKEKSYNINNIPNGITNINQLIQKEDPNESILNQNYLTSFKNLNGNNNYQINPIKNDYGNNINSYLTPVSQKGKFENRVNQFYDLNLGNTNERINKFLQSNINDRVSSLGSNDSNFSPNYNQKVLSQGIYNKNTNQFSDCISRSSSPYDSPVSTPKDNKRINYNINNLNNNIANNFQNYLRQPKYLIFNEEIE